MNQLIKQNNELIKIDFAQDTVDLIKKTLGGDLTDNELSMFMYQARRTGLDPLARQIYAIKRGGKTNIQASIDGLRLVAQRSGDYAGQDEPEFVGEPGKPGFHAKVTVYKFNQGQRYPAAVGVAYWEEYCPAEGQNFMWKKMPRTMLSKVAEALALRKGFPQELSGLYTAEEMDQATVVTTHPSGLNIDESKRPAPREKGVVYEKECSECGNQIPARIASWSKSQFGKELCYNCQQKAKAIPNDQDSETMLNYEAGERTHGDEDNHE